MKFIPVITEKSLSESKKGRYTFFVDPSVTKKTVKIMAKKVFGVNVVSVKTLNLKKEIKRNYRGKLVTKKAKKKAIITLKDKEKIDLFEEKKSSKK